jgi:hypothetical protein
MQVQGSSPDSNRDSEAEFTVAIPLNQGTNRKTSRPDSYRDRFPGSFLPACR